jgi:hypothetical protein
MGRRGDQKQQFLAAHPVCCFCGGTTPSVEPDHQPPRAMFDNRQWPEGYVFPACASCNHVTSEQEDIIAFLARSLLLGDENPQQKNEYLEKLRAMNWRHIEMLRSMEMTANQKRRAFKERDLQKPPGTIYSDFPMLNVEHPKITSAIKLFGAKLFLALHYKHHNVIAPPGAHVATLFVTNIQVEQGKIDDNIRSLMGRSAELVRACNDLSDQFNYSYAFSESDPSIGAYLCFFRRSFALIGFVCFSGFADTPWQELPEKGFYLSRPFDPSTSS